MLTASNLHLRADVMRKQPSHWPFKWAPRMIVATCFFIHSLLANNMSIFHIPFQWIPLTCTRHSENTRCRNFAKTFHCKRAWAASKWGRWKSQREWVKREEKHRKNSNGVENEAHIYNFRCLYHVPSSTHSVVSQRMRARGTIQTF